MYKLSEIKKYWLNLRDFLKEILGSIKGWVTFLWKNKIYVFYAIVALIFVCFVFGVLNYLTNGVFLKWVTLYLFCFFLF